MWLIRLTVVSPETTRTKTTAHGRGSDAASVFSFLLLSYRCGLTISQLPGRSVLQDKASAMPAGAAAPGEAAGSRLAWGRWARHVWGGGWRTCGVQGPVGSRWALPRGLWGLYPFRYGVYLSGG